MFFIGTKTFLLTYLKKSASGSKTMFCFLIVKTVVVNTVFFAKNIMIVVANSVLALGQKKVVFRYPYRP